MASTHDEKLRDWIAAQMGMEPMAAQRPQEPRQPRPLGPHPTPDQKMTQAVREAIDTQIAGGDVGWANVMGVELNAIEAPTPGDEGGEAETISEAALAAWGLLTDAERAAAMAGDAGAYARWEAATSWVEAQVASGEWEIVDEEAEEAPEGESSEGEAGEQ